MGKLISILIHKKKRVIVFFTLLTIICAIASFDVKINYNLNDYLPDESPSTTALNTMDEEYSKGAPNARVMLKDVTVSDALKIKEQIKAVDGVLDVTWLDDAMNIYQPMEFADPDTVEDYYKDSKAMMQLTIDSNKQNSAVLKVREIIGNDNCMSGNAVDVVMAQELTTKEIQRILIFVVILILAILFLTTTSWIEPILFMLTIGVAIMISRGTNLFFGEISFVTNAAGTILQLAVSMDYSIFILHRFAEFRKTCPNVDDAMINAVKKSFGSVMSSGLTTVMGFAALILMNFKIGPDMGYVMAKAIAISLLCVILFLPSLTMCCYKLIDKTAHRSFIPPFDKMSKGILQIGKTALIIFFIIVIPSYLAQGRNDFTYGQSGIYGAGTQLGDDISQINETFGESNPMVLMVPKDTLYKERQLADELLQYDTISSVTSYAKTVGTQIPYEMIPKDATDNLISNKYSRLIITVDTPAEGTAAFGTVDHVKEVAQKYYGQSYMILGVTVNSYDLKDVVTEDNSRVNFLAILAIAIILLINFKSIGIPLLLLLVIEASIWINLSFPYFADTRLFYIGYLIISSIQLGATVDYAILFADRYIEERATLLPYHAAREALKGTTLSILTSASIMTSAGYLLGLMSTNGVISQLGILVGRGALLSAALVLIVLPTLLAFCDKFIYRTTYKLNFCKEEKQNE